MTEYGATETERERKLRLFHFAISIHIRLIFGDDELRAESFKMIDRLRDEDDLDALSFISLVKNLKNPPMVLERVIKLRSLGYRYVSFIVGKRKLRTLEEIDEFIERASQTPHSLRTGML